MAIREEKNYGKRISEKLSEYLTTYTGINDWLEVAEMERIPVGFSTIRDVIYRRNRLTFSNSIAIEEVTRAAVKNCTQAINKRQDHKNALKYMIRELPVEAEEVK